MNWDAIGAVGEIVGAIAVLLTLGYLALQIRQNNKSIRSSIYTSWVDIGSLVHTLRAEYPEVFEKAISPGREPELLTKQEAQIAESICAHMFNLFEAHYLHYVNGTIDEHVFDSKRRNMRWRMESPFVRQTWFKIAEHVYDHRFIDFVNREVLGSEDSESG
ncbi:MAG: hypothetical protein R3E82_23235 [Pseudomonadales bacterium]